MKKILAISILFLIGCGPKSFKRYANFRDEVKQRYDCFNPNEYMLFSVGVYRNMNKPNELLTSDDGNEYTHLIDVRYLGIDTSKRRAFYVSMIPNRWTHRMEEDERYYMDVFLKDYEQSMNLAWVDEMTVGTIQDGNKIYFEERDGCGQVLAFEFRNHPNSGEPGVRVTHISELEDDKETKKYKTGEYLSPVLTHFTEIDTVRLNFKNYNEKNEGLIVDNEFWVKKTASHRRAAIRLTIDTATTSHKRLNNIKFGRKNERFDFVYNP